MNKRQIIYSVAVGGFLTLGIGWAVTPAHAISAAGAIAQDARGAGDTLVDAGRRRRRIARRGSRAIFPIAPTYQAYDYPYYYSRGFYPRHIGPGYVYFGQPYNDTRRRYAALRDGCVGSRRRCAWRRRYRAD